MFVIIIEKKVKVEEPRVALIQSEERIMMLNPVTKELMIIFLKDGRAISTLIIPRADDFMPLFVTEVKGDLNVIDTISGFQAIAIINNVLDVDFAQTWIKTVSFITKK